MKYRVLLIGNNKRVINEFFTYMDYEFECISTSEHYDDIMNHIKYVHPDVFVYCLYQERLDDIKRFVNLVSKESIRRIPLVIIGAAEECTEFVQMAPFLHPLVLQRPISTQNIKTEIIKMLEKRKAAEEDENTSVEKMPVEEEQLHKEEVSSETKVNRRKHILIVDDDSRMLRMLQSYLSPRYDLATAINGKVAMKFLETKETDLVLLDYEMPMENGAAVLEKIRANEKTKDLPVVFLTGVTEKNKIKEVLALKPQGYLLKPIDVERVSSTIKGILE